MKHSTKQKDTTTGTSDNNVLWQKKLKARHTELQSMKRGVAYNSHRNLPHAKADRNMVDYKD